MLTSMDLLAIGLANQVAEIGIKCLAVAGGYLAGNFLGGVIIWGLDRWLFRAKTPDSLRNAIRLILGAIVALLVALVLFGDGGGGGLFGGTGNGDGKAQPAESTSESNDSKDKSNNNPAKTDIREPSRIDVTKTTEIKPSDTLIRVTFLGGDDVSEKDKFYLLDDEKTPKTFEELKTEISRRQKERPQAKTWLLFQFTKKNHVVENSRTVSQVQEFAAENGVGVSRSGEK